MSDDTTRNPDGDGRHRPADDIFASLEDADPAARAEVDVQRLRALVDERIAGDRSVTSPQLWMRVAAAVVGAAVIGAAGFVIGSRGGSSGDLADGAGSPAGTTQMVAAQPEMAPNAGMPAPGGFQTGAAAGPMGGGAENDARSAGADGSFAMGTGRTVFADGGLSTDGAMAEGWTYDASQVFSAAKAEQIAAVFGVSGTATPQWGSWAVGPTDGSGPQVTLSGDAMVAVSFYNPTVQPYGGGCYAYSSSAPDGATAAVETCASTPPDAPAISQEDAQSRARQLLAAVGLDPSQFTFAGPGYDEGAGLRSVTAIPNTQLAANGGYGWYFTYFGDTLISANGQLAPLVSAGQFDVISPADAVLRLNDPRFGPIYPTYPINYAWPEYTERSQDATPTAPQVEQ